MQSAPAPGTSRGALYQLRSPDFRRERFSTLQFAAIGSGWHAVNDIDRHFEFILTAGHGDAMQEAEHFRMAIDSYMRRRLEPSVGGMIPVIRVRGDDVELCGGSYRIKIGTPDETEIALFVDAKTGWTQCNLTTGKRRSLVPPWQLPARLPRAKDDRFDDMLDAW